MNGEHTKPVESRTEDQCPACGGQLQRIEVDIGVGIQYGPAHCRDCAWQEPEPDLGLIDGDPDDWEKALEHF